MTRRYSTPRGYCTMCGRKVSARRDGRPYPHRKPMDKGAVSTAVDNCPGRFVTKIHPASRGPRGSNDA